MLSVEMHARQPDGSVRLVLRVGGPLPDEPTVVLADVGGTVTQDGDDALVSWDWPASVVPPDTVTVCGRHVLRVMEEWAAGWAAPLGITLTETGTVV